MSFDRTNQLELDRIVAQRQPEDIREYITKLRQLHELLNGPSAPVPPALASFLAFNVLRVSDRMPCMDAAAEGDFFDRVLEYIAARKEQWVLFLCMIGNLCSVANHAVATKLLSQAYLFDMLKDLLSGDSPESSLTTPTGSTITECCAWVISNLVHSTISCGILPQRGAESAMLPFSELVPVMLRLAETSKGQLAMRCFRSLCAIFSDKHMRTVHRAQWLAFGNLVTNGDILKDLCEEFGVGLRGAPIPGTSFYPDPEDRALCVSLLSQTEEGKDALVACGAVCHITKSLNSLATQSAPSSSRMWARSVRTLHNFVQSPKYHSHLTQDPLILSLITISRSISFHTNISDFHTRRLAADAAVALGLKWDIERLFWIAVTTPQTNCMLSQLPKEVVRRIMVWYMLISVEEPSLPPVNRFSPRSRRAVL